MDKDFQYIIDKVWRTPCEEAPFKHLELFDFLSPPHFEAVTRSPQVAIPPAESISGLAEALQQQGYEAIPFPGCTTSFSDYVDWYVGDARHTNIAICEGFGMTFRLKEFAGGIVEELNGFLNSDDFLDTVAEKFGIDRGATYPDNGLQKYLDGYEISPHPDTRKKALTYMLNVNPAADSEALEIHTHYLNFKPEKSFIGEFWRHDKKFDRCWVPWDWCESVKQQRSNNSLIMFAPAHDTLHAIKARYDHLQTQRTQFYGNLWYDNVPSLPKLHWDRFDFRVIEAPAAPVKRPRIKRFFDKIKSAIRA